MGNMSLYTICSDCMAPIGQEKPPTEWSVLWVQLRTVPQYAAFHSQQWWREPCQDLDPQQGSLYWLLQKSFSWATWQQGAQKDRIIFCEAFVLWHPLFMPILTRCIWRLYRGKQSGCASSLGTFTNCTHESSFFLHSYNCEKQEAADCYSMSIAIRAA